MPAVIAVLLLIVGGIFIKDMAILIIGFNLIFSYRDFIELGISENIVMTSVIFGTLFIIGGIMMLAKSRTEDYINLLFEL